MNKKILVIDDEVNVLKVIKSRLQASDYSVITSTEGEEAIKKALSESPALILLDVHMPGIDGFEVLRRLRKHPQTKALPVVMLTCEDELQSVLLAKELKVTDYILKPFKPEKLLEVVKMYLERK
jgi:two-component system alkaline phosphatase synthesis response regulator PhoP